MRITTPYTHFYFYWDIIWCRDGGFLASTKMLVAAKHAYIWKLKGVNKKNSRSSYVFKILVGEIA